MAVREGVAETLKRISELKSRNDKIVALRTDHSIAMQAIVDLCFNPKYKFLLPEGQAPYKPQPKESDHQAVLISNLRKLKIFYNSGTYDNLNQLKRESLFIEFLESLDPDDAELIVSIKDKKMPYKGITRKLFEDAWPALASTWN